MSDQNSVSDAQESVWPPPPCVEPPTLPLPKRRQRPPLTWLAVLYFVLGFPVGYYGSFFLNIIVDFTIAPDINKWEILALNQIISVTIIFFIGRRWYFFAIGMAVGAIITAITISDAIIQYASYMK